MSTINDIRQHFINGMVLTSCDAARMYLTADLRKYVSVLKKDEEMPINSEWKTSENGKRYKVYWLDQSKGRYNKQDVQ